MLFSFGRYWLALCHQNLVQLKPLLKGPLRQSVESKNMAEDQTEREKYRKEKYCYWSLPYNHTDLGFIHKPISRTDFFTGFSPVASDESNMEPETRDQSGEKDMSILTLSQGSQAGASSLAAALEQTSLEVVSLAVNSKRKIGKKCRYKKRMEVFWLILDL